MPAGDVKVLFGDSTPSTLPPDILDVILGLVLCARDIGNASSEIDELAHKHDEGSDVTAAIVAELDAFQRQCEIGMRATAIGAKRPELVAHGEEAVAAIAKLVDGWRSHYLARLDGLTTRVTQRTDELQQAMRAAIERFMLPRRDRVTERWLRRTFDGTAYRTTATLEPFLGIRIELALTDTSPEAPRKIRSMIGKGTRLQIGTKRSRLRRSEEPAFVVLDDLAVLDSEIGRDRARIQLAKKPGTQPLQIELVKAEDGMRGAGARPDGVRASLPVTDRPVMEALWNALQDDAHRTFAGPAQLTILRLDSKVVETPDDLIAITQRLVEMHRPIIAKIATHSPNDAELTVKLETPDGKREEAWVRRDELAQHLLGLPAPVLARLTIPELYRDGDSTGGIPAPPMGMTGAIGDAHGGDDSERIDLGALAAAVAAPAIEVTEDISLHELLLESDIVALDDDDCAGPTKIRSRGTI